MHASFWVVLLNGVRLLNSALYRDIDCVDSENRYVIYFRVEGRLCAFSVRIDDINFIK